MNTAQQARLRLIDFLLAHYGTFNRGVLMDYFGLSQPQVSLDIRAYTELAPTNLEYDRSQRTYKRSTKFARALP